MKRTCTQRGAAVVMALFVVTLCTLAVGPLLWNLFASAKTVSVTAARDQAELVSRSGVDWARVILREDGRVSTTDTLTEPWAVPLAESRISEGLMRKGETIEQANEREVLLSGRIEDAQGRFNLRNLGLDNSKRAQWLEGFMKLCDLLAVNPKDRATLADVLGRMYLPAGGSEPSEKQVLGLVPARTWDDLRGQYGLAEETWLQLRPLVVILPRFTPVNANTASAEVLYASVPGLSFPQAQSVISQRARVSFKDLNDLNNALGPSSRPNNDLMAVSTAYFLIDGSAKVEGATIRTRALVERRDQRVFVIWRQY